MTRRDRSTHWKDVVRPRIFERDGWRCRECGKAARLEVDHVIPLHKGGTNLDDNLQSLCRKCHRRKTWIEGKGKYERKNFHNVEKWDTYLQEIRE